MKLIDFKRFVNQKNKIPVGKWNDEANWMNYNMALANAKRNNCGISIVLGKINDEYTLAGIDIDTIRDKLSGKIDTNIEEDIKAFKHKHISMSGYGVHILCLIKNSALVANRKVNIKSNLNINRIVDGKQKFPEIEFYTSGKLFALPSEINVLEDNITDMTNEYLKIYNKYTNNNTNIENGDESRKDYKFIIDLIKSGHTDRDEIKDLFLQSDLFKNKDSMHKRKILERKDYLDRTITSAFKNIEEKEEKNQIQFNKVLDLINDKNIFIDERDNAYIVINYQNIKIESRKFEQFLTFECFENNIKINPQIINNLKSYLTYKAIKENKKYELNVRFAGTDNEFYYQLSEEDIVKIDKYGYSIIKNDTPLFKWVNMKEQILPQRSNTDFKRIWEYFNVEENQRLLFLVYVISLFIPNIPKPILIFSAERGAGKTTSTKLVKLLVDPSLLEITSFPRDLSSFSQMLDRSALICFDNLGRLQLWQSDALCRAYSGEATSKRKLYTDEEDVVFQYKRAIILNGINCPATREDILDRSILINLKRIRNYKEERVIFNEWNALKPELLDLIFNTLVKALQIYNITKIDISARTADWLKWGYCIAESIKKGLGEDFLECYKDNVTNQNDQVIENNVLVQAVLEFMEKQNHWQGSATDLYNMLRAYVSDYGIVGFPKSSSWLTRDLKSLLSIFESQNIKIEFLKATNKGSNIKLTKC